MTAYSLPERHVRGTVVELDEDDVDLMVWILPDDSTADSKAVRVNFQREGEQVDPALIGVVAGLEKGEVVELSFVEFVDGESVVRRGRSLTRD